MRFSSFVVAVAVLLASACAESSQEVASDQRTALQAEQEASPNPPETKDAAEAPTIEEFAQAVVNTPYYAGADYSIAPSPEDAASEASVVVRGRVVGLEVGPVSESDLAHIAEELGHPTPVRRTLAMTVQAADGAEHVVAIPISDGAVPQPFVEPLVAEGLEDAEAVVAGDLIEGILHPSGMSAVVLGADAPKRTVILSAPHADAWGLTDTAEIERRMRAGLGA